MRRLQVFVATNLLAVLLLTSPAFANEYSRVANLGVTVQGAYFYSPSVSLNSYWSTSQPCRFIIKTHWLGFADSNGNSTGWIEIGRVHGAMSDPSSSVKCGLDPVSNYNAYYVATQNGSLYDEWPVTGFGTTGAHNFQVQRTGFGEWTAYIDYTAVRKFTRTEQNAARHRVGFESNYSDTWFASPSDTTSHQVLVNGTWEYWTSGSREDASTGYNNVNWNTVFGKKADGTTDYAKATTTHP